METPIEYDFYYHIGAKRYVRRGTPEETIRGYRFCFDNKTKKYSWEGSMTMEEKQDQFIRYMKNSDWEQAYKCREWLLEFPHTLVNILLVLLCCTSSIVIYHMIF